MDSKPRASSVCSLDEAPDDYRGYLPAAEIAARLAAIGACLQERDQSDLAGQIAELRRLLPEGGAAESVTEPAAALDALLPRISDDRLHAALRAIRAAL